MTIEQRIEASRARLAELEAKSHELWKEYKAAQEAIKPQEMIWYTAHNIANAERERLAGLLQIAEEDAQAISMVPEPTSNAA